VTELEALEILEEEPDLVFMNIALHETKRYFLQSFWDS